MASLPYVPTWTFSPSSQSNLVYILQPSGANSGNFELLVLNTTQSLDTTSLPLETLSATLPFENDGKNTAISPAMDAQDNILVYTGDCTKGSKGSSLWQFKPLPGNLIGNGTWQEIQLSNSSDNGASDLEGANYLASAIAFSSITNATADVYVFGGMCPNTTTSTPSDWTQNAAYSNNMLNFESSQSSLSPVPLYDFTVSSSRSGPIAEAGFTITPLVPTFSESAQNQTQSVNQNYVLIGGHTQQAFINMSQVALFSLPQQSWSFVSVDAPSSTPPTDLAVRVVNSIDSRSGHSAILTPDGKKILVFGGWVGDVTTPANPQLAVLELGQGYGGDGDWQWAIPTATGNGIPPGTGIYGHGAAMIAGDVMLITGGFQIPASGSNRRRGLPSSNTVNYLFNTSSVSFISSYTHPYVSSGPANQDADSNDTQTKERVGLGVGLTIGIIALIIVVIIYFWYSRRLKRRRDARDEELRKLAVGAQRFHLTNRDGTQAAHRPEMTQLDSAHGSSHGPYQPQWDAGNSTTSNVQPVGHAGPEAARTGLLLDVPSPTRGLRRSLHSRGSYQPAPRYDDGRRGLISTIHPIDERDEDNEGVTDNALAADNDTIQRSDFQLLDSVPVLDPFRDGSRTPSPQSPEQREAEVRGWMNDWTEAEAMMSSWNRGSPEKTDRTSSTLSDMSAKSMQSYSSLQRSTGGPSRSVSQKSGGVFSSVPLHSTNSTAPQNDLLGRSNSSQQQSGHDRSRSLTLQTGVHHAPTNSDATDKSFNQPHHENDTLLGNRTIRESTSPSRIGRRAKGWMGSMRRVFTGGVDHTSTASPGHTKTAHSSPTKDGFNDVDIPQRAASTGHMFLQRRQGAKDWEPEGSRPANESGTARKGEGDEDWDVESAVERRVVQVMFTVPKEKLRVVNRNPDGDGESVLSSMYEDAIEGDAASVVGKGKEKE